MGRLFRNQRVELLLQLGARPRIERTGNRGRAELCIHAASPIQPGPRTPFGQPGAS